MDSSTPALDDGPMTVKRGENWCCLLCQRQFQSERQLAKHLEKSDLHKTNLREAVENGRIREPANAGKRRDISTAATDPPAKRERVSELRGPSDALRAMEEVERALAGQAAAGSGRLGGAASGKGAAAYRDRAKERRELFGNDSVPTAFTGSVKSARDINGNRDWRCSGCSKVNFARTIVCISCSREVDADTEYLDSTEYQKVRHQGIMKLAQRLQD